MFKLITITLLSTVCICRAYPQNAANSADAQATLLSNTFADDGAGNFNFAFETSNGIKEQAQGQLKDITVPTYDASGQKTGEGPSKGETQQGSYSYTAPDGTPITGNYNLFRAFFNLIN